MSLGHDSEALVIPEYIVVGLRLNDPRRNNAMYVLVRLCEMLLLLLATRPNLSQF